MMVDFRQLQILTGFEDEFGWMDFKVTGTDEGITAIQMDIKYKGGLQGQFLKLLLNKQSEADLYFK